MTEKSFHRLELNDQVRFGCVPSLAEVIQDELDARGWSLVGFAARIRWELAEVKAFLQSRFLAESGLSISDVEERKA